jgi:4-hydroxy-4-methyl-2-oxoglutarate aldolase
MHPDIKPLDPAWRVCGPAFTVRPEFWDDRLMGELAPKFARTGDVLVVDAGGHREIAVWGLSMTMAATGAGVAGVVIDGTCMNGALLVDERPQIPLFTRGLSPIAKGAEQPGSLNVPVICGGVIVYPGDIILADRDGVVVLPPGIATRVIAEVDAHDQQARADAKANVPYYERERSEEKLRAFKDVDWN